MYVPVFKLYLFKIVFALSVWYKAGTFREISLPFGSEGNCVCGWGSDWVLTPRKSVISSRHSSWFSEPGSRPQSILLLCVTELFVKCIGTKALDPAGADLKAPSPETHLSWF